MVIDSSAQLVNPSETPVQPQPIQPTPIYKQRVFLPIILGIIVLGLIIGSGAYYLGTQKNQPLSNQQGSNQLLQVEPTLTTTPTQSPPPSQGNNLTKEWKSYTDSAYSYTIQYPTEWTLKQEKDSEGSNRIRIVSNNTSKATFSLRILPELYITVANPYSTSGAVCANQSCAETPPLLEIRIMNRDLAIPVTKGEVLKDGDKQFDFYAFTFPLPGKKVPLQGYSEPVELNAIASYKTREEGQIIASILSTLTY